MVVDSWGLGYLPRWDCYPLFWPWSMTDMDATPTTEAPLWKIRLRPLAWDSNREHLIKHGVVPSVRYKPVAA